MFWFSSSFCFIYLLTCFLLVFASPSLFAWSLRPPMVTCPFSRKGRISDWSRGPTFGARKTIVSEHAIVPSYSTRNSRSMRCDMQPISYKPTGMWKTTFEHWLVYVVNIQWVCSGVTAQYQHYGLFVCMPSNLLDILFLVEVPNQLGFFILNVKCFIDAALVQCCFFESLNP